MHRIPLLIPTPSICWDRNLPEWCLFNRTLNKVNMDETNSFLTILDSEAEFYRNQCYIMAEDMFQTAKHYLMESNSKFVSEGLFFLNYLILRTPKDSWVLASALKVRGNVKYHDCHFEESSNDYEMYLEVYKSIKTPNEEICEVYGQLVLCMYMMRKFLKVKKYFRSYKKYKAKLIPEILQKPAFVNIENYIKQFITEIIDIENDAPKISESQYEGIPYKGFSTDVELPAASSMCFTNNNGISVKEEIPKASVLLVEDQSMPFFNIPLIDCEVCYKHSPNQIYTCLECRYKSYCSLNCLEKDKAVHQDECIGYKQLTILVLDAGSIFRTFVRVSKQLSENFFNPQIFRKLRTAEEVWDKMLELLKKNQANDRDLALVKIKPSYCRLTEIQYSTLVATAFRLTAFIERKTELIAKYYKKLLISNKQKLIVIGSILMRMHCNMLLNSFDFEITKAVNVRKPLHLHMSIKEIDQMMQTINRRPGFVKSIDTFYDIDLKRDIWKRSNEILSEKKVIKEMSASHLTVLRHVKSCNRIPRFLSTYKDNVAELYFQPALMHSIIYGQAASEPTSSASSKKLCGRIADMTDIDRYMFVKKFARLFHIHYAEYFLQMFGRDQEVKQVLTLYCPTLRKFKHSCDPNVEVIVLDNGVVIGKSLRKIQKGEQLFVSYKAHYACHARGEREKFLKMFNVKCKCEYCKMSELVEPTNLRLEIFCESCKGVKITPSQFVCPLCNSLYNTLFNKYRTIIFILENKLKTELSPCKSTERDIYIIHLILYSYAKMYFAPQNELRITIELKMGNFFAVQNFSKQAYSLIKEIRDIVFKAYDEELILFTFYAEILLIIKIILFNNLEDKLLSLPTSDLLDLCSFGLHIANRQKDYIEFYEIFDIECSNILDDIKDLLKWKDKIICSEFLPLANFLSMPDQKIQ